MFITVHFGECRSELFNPNCRIINFIQSLKERCSVDFEDSVDLVDTAGELVNLSDQEQPQKLASSFLRDRHSYVLVRVNRGDGGEGHKYEPLLSNLGKSHPELAELLKKLSNPPREREKKSCLSRKAGLQREAPANHTMKTKPASSPKKSNASLVRN